MTAPIWSGVLLAEARPSWFDPHNQIAGAARVLAGNITPGLLRIGDHAEPAAELARAWSWNTDRVLTIELEPSRQFSTGREVTADAVAENLIAIAHNPSLFNSDEASLIGGVAVEDEYRLAVELTRPFPALLGMLANGLGMIDMEAARSSHDVAGAGAYRIAAWTRHSIELVNTTSPDSKVSWRFAGTARSRRLHLARGSADAMLGSVGRVDVLAHGWNELCVAAQGPIHLAFNLLRAPMSDLQFRKDVAQALDRETILGEGFGGRATVGVEPFAANSKFHASPEGEFSPTRSSRAVPNRRAPLLLAVGGAAYLATARSVARAVQRGTGREVKVVSVANEYWWPSYYMGGEWDLAVQAWTPMPDPHFVYGRRYASWGVHNATGYESPVVDAGVRAAMRTVDHVERMVHYRRVEAQRQTDIPTIYLGYPHRTVMSKPGTVPPLAKPSWDVALSPATPTTQDTQLTKERNRG